MLDPERARLEKKIVGEYFKFDDEEYEVVDDDDGDRDHDHDHDIENGRPSPEQHRRD